MKNIKKTIQLMNELIDTCKKMGTTDSLGFFSACMELCNLLEAFAPLEAKKVYSLMLSTLVTYVHYWEKQFHMERVPMLHSNFAVLLDELQHIHICIPDILAQSVQKIGI